MTDIEIIREMEKILGVPLLKLEFDDIETEYYRDIKRGYSLDSMGAVVGLRLESLFIKPVLGHVDRLRRLTRLNIEECQLDQSDIDCLCDRSELTYLNLSYNKGIQDFSFLQELKGLTTVDLRGNGLTDVSFLRELKELTSVNLRGNQLKNVSYLRELKRLTSLNLSGNSLADVSFLRELKKLITVDLAYNNILIDISFLRELKELTSVNLNWNKLPDVSFLRELKGLTSIELGGNNFTDISFLRELKGLTSVDLSWDKGIQDFSFLREFKGLTSVVLSGNNLTDISFLQKMKGLTAVNAAYNNLTDVSYLQDLKGLTSVNLNWNNLTDVSFLKGLKGLTAVDLGHNNLSDVSFLKELKGLVSVDLGYNNLSDFSFLRELKRLTFVDLSGNNLTDVSFLQELERLTMVNLNWNNISDVSFLGKLRGLSAVDLKSNNITDISFVKGLDHLTDLDVDENPLINPPPEIVKHGLDAIRDYFRSLNEKELCRLNEVKILLVGSGGSGKTSLFKRFSNQAFDPNENLTHGIRIYTINIEIDKPTDTGPGPQSTLVHAHFWDFGGQEVMHASHQFFLSKRSLYILVVDSREEQTAEYWLKNIETFGGSSPVLVVINKTDENPHFDLDRYTLKRKYPNILDFYRISCKSEAGLPELRDAIKSAIPKTELLQTPVAASWMKVKSTLETMTKSHCYISHSEFHAICDNASIPTDTTRETLIQFLNELGIALHFKDLELQEYYVLNPRWVTEGVYRIINSPTLAERHGLLKKADLGRIINEEKTKTRAYSQDLKSRVYTPGEQNYIVKLMQKFELCYALDEETILVPALLDAKEPPLPEETRPTLDFILTYDFLPKSVISRLLVKLHKDLTPGQSWRTGMVLESELFHTHALIRADEVEKTIGIHISGDQKREHLSVIRCALREINKSFQLMKIEELIPLPLPADILRDYREKNKGVGKYARTVSYPFLLGYERNGQSEYLDGETGQRYRVAQLLDSVTLPEERKRESFDYDGPQSHFSRPMPEPVSPVENCHRFEQYYKLDQRIKTLEKQAADARKRKNYLDARARKRVIRRFAILLGIDILFIAALCILLFKKVLTLNEITLFSFIAGPLLFAGNLGYLMIKGNSFSLTSIYNRNLERAQEDLYQRDNFDAAGLAKLEKELEQAIKERDGL